MKNHRILTTAALFLTLLVAALPALAQSSGENAPRSEKVVNVNTAEEAQLALLPRIGPALAARIVEFREANGEFEVPEDLMLVSGIGERTFELMEPWVAIDGETTLTEPVSSKRAAERAETSGDEKG